MPRQTGNVHEIESQVEADDEQPEMPLRERFVVHPAGHFGIPVVEGAEKRKKNCADDDVVEMRDHKVGAGELPVEGRRGQHDAGEAGDEKLEKERDAETASER